MSVINETNPMEAIAKTRDESIRPQDDLFRHVNGRYLAEHEIPEDRASDGAFYQLHEASLARVRDIIEHLADDAATPAGDTTPTATPATTTNDAAAAGDAAADDEEARMIGDLYAAFMDVDTLNKLGATPLDPIYEQIDAAEDHSELAAVLGDLDKHGVASLFYTMIDADVNEPSRQALYIGQGGLSLPDESYYREESFAEVRAAFEEFLGEFLPLVNLDAERSQEIVDFETKVASHHWDVVATRDTDKTNNPCSWSELTGSAPGYDWEAWRAALGLPDADAVQMQNCNNYTPSATREIAQIWSETELDLLKQWVKYRAAASYARMLSEEIAEAHFAFFGRTLTGQPQMQDRWKRGVGVVERHLGEAVGKYYVQRHFPPEHKAQMEKLVKNLLRAYHQSITDLDWMGEETKQRALEKLGTFFPKIGYPDTWRSYAGMGIVVGDLLASVRAGSAFETARQIKKFGEPTDRGEWHMLPQTVNAYYNPTLNEIVFPAAILQPPFFQPDADEAWNYGGIGAVIGHEIGHGFDDQGSKFDAQGRVHNWWTDADRQRFEERTKALIDQYSAYTPTQLGPDSPHHVNGELTIGENIGDLGGLTIALKAYAISLADQGIDSPDDAPLIDGLTGIQRVFFAWARVWCGKRRDELAIQLLTVDPHSPEEFRCNGVVRNLDTFARAFDVTEGDALFLPEDERVSIW